MSHNFELHFEMLKVKDNLSCGHAGIVEKSTKWINPNC